MYRRLIAALATTLPSLALAAVPCGNGAVDPGETCDDANTVAADGCSATCAIEEGFACDNAGATNLLVNAGFESGTTGWTTDATIGTGVRAQDGEIVVTAEPNSYVNGSCLSGACIDGNAGGVVWRQTVTVAPSTEYRFSAFAAVRTDGGGSATSRLSLRVDGADLTPVFDEDTAPPAPWRPFGATFTTAANQTSVVLEVYNAYLQDPGNGFHLDELALVRAPSKCKVAPPPAVACGNGTVGHGEGCDDANTVAADGCSATCATEPGFACDNTGATNLLANGGFEDGTTGWSADATIGTGTRAQDGEIVVTAEPNSYVNGSCLSGACIDGNAGGVVWRQTVTVAASTEYRFSAFAAVRTDGGGSATSKLSLRVDGSDITPVFEEDAAPPAPWRPFGATFTTAANQTSVLLEVYNAYLQDPGNGFHLDELALVRSASKCALESPPDAGSEAPDAGSEAPDAGSEATDAGSEAPDAGAQVPDAGVPTDTGAVVDGGCGCGSASSGWAAAALVALAGLVPRRRASRAKSSGGHSAAPAGQS